MHKTLIGLCFVGLLAGCSGNTYGTGVSSEQQLLTDVTSMVSLGGSKKKEKINYAARPTLVKPPVVAELPPPAESVKSESAYFPEDPEIKRQRLLAELEEAEANGTNTGDLSPEVQAMREESLARKKAAGITTTSVRGGAVNSDGDCFTCDFYERTNGDKQRLAQKTAERQQTGVQKRRYLTEPPDEYRRPAETADVGVLGEEELSEAAIAKKKRKKKSILDGIFGG
ncbi:MAG: hypothetical protein ABJM29_19230 [Rhizobiaceae bacterium]